MTEEPIVYRLEHSSATVEIAVDFEKLHIGTCGVGLIDKPKINDARFADVRGFAIVPTIVAQNLARRQGSGEPYDRTYDAEFLVHIRVDGKDTKRRMFVDSQNTDFQRLIAALCERCPTGSLLHLDPAVARKQMGFASPRTAIFIILFLLIGLPILIAMVAIAYMAITGFK